MTLYNLRSTELGFKITKFDSDLNPESSYDMSLSGFGWTCTCPASHRKDCRHRKMAPVMVDRVDTGWFYDFDTKLWCDPLGQGSEELIHPRAHAQSLDGALESGFVQMVSEPTPTIKRRA